MKKLLTVLLAAAIAASSCISLASCSDDKKEKKEETSTTVEATVNKEEEDQATKDEADDSEADLMMLHGVSSEPQNDFTGPWQIVDGEGSQYKSFVYMFDGTTKSVLMTGSVGQMAVYSVSDETDDSGKTQTYFESKMLFGINGKYTFKFSDDKQKVVLTNTEDKKTTTLQRLATYEYIPIPSEKPKIDNKLLGAWKCDDGEMLYFNNSGIMYKVMTGINFYFATYNADGKTVNWQYSYKESKPKNEKADYSISGNTLTFDNSTYTKVSSSELV